MSDRSGIEWTDATWNPVTGCTKVSPGCDHCYAETMHERFHGKGSFATVTLAPHRLDVPLKWRKPRRVFVNSMSDLFHDDVPDEYIAQVWQVMGAAPQHTYQILTKRHARMRSWVNRWYAGDIAEPFDSREVPGYPGYRVTTTGLVIGRRSDTADGLTPDIGEQGHRRVTMHRGSSPNSGERELVHRLVLTAFVRPPVPGEQACHRNGDPSDNRLSNLYWGAQQDNWRDRSAHGNRRSYAKLTPAEVAEIRQRCSNGESAYRVAKDYPVSDTQIRNITSGDQWKPEPEPIVVRQPERVVLPQVWLGVSAEDQKWADIRIPALLETPSAVRWVSAEPLLGPIDLSEYVQAQCECCDPAPGRPCVEELAPLSLDWVVVGGESGPGARPMDPEWARSLRDQCVAARVPFLFKQWGSHVDGKRVGKGKAGRALDGRFHDEYPAVAS